MPFLIACKKHENLSTTSIYAVFCKRYFKENDVGNDCVNKALLIVFSLEI